MNPIRFYLLMKWRNLKRKFESETSKIDREIAKIEDDYDRNVRLSNWIWMGRHFKTILYAQNNLHAFENDKFLDFFLEITDPNYRFPWQDYSLRDGVQNV